MDGNDDLFARLMLTEPTIAKLTEEAVATALSPMSITARRDNAWLARAVKGALYTSLTPASDGPDRQSNADTRNELTKLAAQASTFWLSLVERSSSADQALWDAAFRRWDGEGGTTIDGVTIGEPSLYAEFANTVKLPHLLELKYGTPQDAVQQLGSAALIRETFRDFQRGLYKAD